MIVSRACKLTILNRLTASCILLAVVGCSPTQSDQVDTQPAIIAGEKTLSTTATVLDEGRVKFEIETTLPLPVEVMIGVSLKGQAPDDVYIGYSERTKIEKARSEFILDTRLSKDILPDGEYEAEVSFYPFWGADNGNHDAKSAPELHARSDVVLKVTGVDRASTERKNELQKWVMLNIEMNVPWNRENYEAKLGPAEKGPSTMSRLHDAYYFPEADVTLLVNRLKNEVTVWRLGDVTE